MAYVQNNPFPITPCGRRRTLASEGSPMKRNKPHTSWTQSDRDKYNRETGSNLKPPQPGGGARKRSYCARSAGIKKCKNPDKNGDCPNDIARRKWKC
tara:strand:- start:90 stop:380 length:291 start_codon:yes stop_codon:yes gene_type:complete